MKKTLLATILALGLATSAQAAIIYVDATTANTVFAPSAGGGAWTTVGVDAVDGMWRARTGFGLNPAATVPGNTTNQATDTVYESGGNSGADNAARLVTTVGSLPSATYDVYAYFWSDQNGSPWRIGAALTDAGGQLPLFIGGGGPSGSPLPVQVGLDSANRVLWQASLGQVTGTSINVYIDDSATMASGNERSWYDGVGYARIPEPATGALLGLGLTAVGAVRRRSVK